jgi:hypothetical protein
LDLRKWERHEARENCNFIICTLDITARSNQIGEACNTHGKKEKCTQSSGRKPKRFHFKKAGINGGTIVKWYLRNVTEVTSNFTEMLPAR